MYDACQKRKGIMPSVCYAGVDFAEGQPFFQAFAFHNIPGYADNLKVSFADHAD